MLTPVTFADCMRLGATGMQEYFVLNLFAIFLGFTLWFIRKPLFSGKKFFVTANLAVIFWLFAVVMELVSVTAGCKVLWSTLAYPGIGLLSASWFMFIYRYTRDESGRVLPWQWALLLVVPTMSTVAAVSTPWHGLFYGPDTATINFMPSAPVVYDHGVLFYANAVMLCTFQIASWIMLGVSIARSAANEQLTFVTLFLITSVPALANLSYLALGVDIVGLNPTPFLFLFVLLAYSRLNSVTNFFQVSSIAKDMIFDNLPNAVVVVTSEGRIIASNLTAQKLLSFTFIQNIAAHDVPVLSDLMRQTVLDAPDGQSIDTAIRNKDYDVTVTPVFNMLKRVIGYTFVFFEVTSRKKAQDALSNALHSTDTRLDAALQQNRQISDDALTDDLTKLLNRRSLPAAFDAMITGQSPPVFAVMLDIDHFKAVNDRMGHAVGDKILIAMGTCLRAAFRTDDKVFRVGGEEFLILSAGITIEALHERIANLRRAVALAGRISLPVDMPLTFSAGVGIWPEDAINFGDLYDIVDKRLYCAKKSGRNRTVGPQNSRFTAPSINNTVVPLVGVG
jgi:diguanylate cyclase (GGDEF)-like protein